VSNVSGAIKKFNVVVVEESDHSVPLTIKIFTVFLYLLCNLLNKLHFRLPWASSVIQVPRGEATALMLTVLKIVRILRPGPNVFSSARLSNRERST